MSLCILAHCPRGSCQTLPATGPGGNGTLTSPPTLQTSHGPMKIIREFIYPVHFQPPSIPSTFGETKPDEGQNAAMVACKLVDIVLPKVSFHATRLADAVEFLRRESIRLDNDPALASRGVRITVQWHRPLGNVRHPESPPGTGLAADTLVTMSRENGPLMSVLSDLAMQAGMMFEVDRLGALLLYQTPDSSGLVTLEIRVPPAFEGMLRVYDPPGDAVTVTDDSVAPPPPAPPKAIPYLEAHGVQFQPGTAAAYLKATSKLLVRNTPDNVDLVQTLVEKAWEQTASSRPANHP